MKFLLCVGMASIMFAPAFAGPLSQSDMIEMSPDESLTLFLTNQDSGATLPMFQICYNSTTGHGAAIRVTSPEMGPAAGYTVPLMTGECIYASGRKLVLSVDADVSPESATKIAEAKEKAKAWADERAAELLARPELTEEQKELLSQIKPGSGSGAAAPVDPRYYEQRAAELGAKPERTQQEEVERVWSQYKALTARGGRNVFKVRVIPS